MKTFASTILGLAIVSGAAGSAFADPDPNKMYVKKIVMNGTGCRPGTAEVSVSPDQTAFTVIYSEFLTRMGPGIDPAEARKNCQLNILMHVPGGFTYAIASVDYRGYANLAAGASGTQKANYYFQGQTPSASTQKTFNGPIDEDWLVHESVDTAWLVFAPCGQERAININTQLRLNKGTSAPNSSSFMTMDSTDGEISQIYHIVWRECPKP